MSLPRSRSSEVGSRGFAWASRRWVALGLAVALISVALPVAVSSADVDGTVTGSVRVRDVRPLRPTGSPPALFAPAERAVVAVTAVPAPTGHELVEINPTFYAVTALDGTFVSSWEDTTRNDFPVRLRITVLWESSNQ